MKRILVIADPYDRPQRIIRRATALAAKLGARIDIVGFIYEHIANLPVKIGEYDIESLEGDLVEKHRQQIQKKFDEVAKDVAGSVEVHWEKRVADWVIQRTQEKNYDLVIKGGHRSETFLYTSTDWQLLRGCRTPVLVIADQRWRGGKHVMAAVDLGTSVKSKLALNYKVVEAASLMAKALSCELHIGYVVPFSKVLRDLDMLDKKKLQREGIRLAREFKDSLTERGIAVEDIHVATGRPEKALVNLAAKNRVGTVVMGCVGRAAVSGKVLGNTAEQILRLVKADVLAIKP